MCRVVHRIEFKHILMRQSAGVRLKRQPTGVKLSPAAFRQQHAADPRQPVQRDPCSDGGRYETLLCARELLCLTHDTLFHPARTH